MRNLEFEKARKFLLDNRDNYEKAYRDFKWPQLTDFNWALDWFDEYAAGNNQIALHIISNTAEDKISFAALSESSSRIAQGFLKLGVKRGDRILIMLGNKLALWESMLAAQKIGAVVIPTALQATADDLSDRFTRGGARLVITDSAQASKFEALPGINNLLKVIIDGKKEGWASLDDLRSEAAGVIPGTTKASDPLFLYFTSGTTAKPKLVLHTHESYPVGHLSTMYWIGIKEKSIHQNISSPGWAKHAWSSFFAPWNAGATILMHDFDRFDANKTLETIRSTGINSLCAPPTVWRMLIQNQLGDRPSALQEIVSAGEPLNPEIITEIESAWGITIRDGYGQTETSAQIGNSPGQKLKPGAMGRPLPGYKVALIDGDGNQSDDGEVALSLGNDRPLALMKEYMGDADKTNAVMAGGFYRTGDEAKRDSDGYYHFVGRGDDVFKSSDYRISPFELESVLLEHDFVVESAVIPSPDPIRLSQPKAVIILAEGVSPTAETAKSIFEYAIQKLPSYKHVRIIEFGELPKTISGKIRRSQLKKEEEQKRLNERNEKEFFWEDLKKS